MWRPAGVTDPRERLFQQPTGDQSRTLICSDEAMLSMLTVKVTSSLPPLRWNLHHRVSAVSLTQKTRVHGQKAT